MKLVKDKRQKGEHPQQGGKDLHSRRAGWEQGAGGSREPCVKALGGARRITGERHTGPAPGAAKPLRLP